MYRILLVIILNIAVILPIYFVLHKNENDRISNVLNVTGAQILNTTTINIANINHELQRSSSIFRQNGIFISNNSFVDYLQFNNFQYKNYVQNFFWVAKVPYNETASFNNFCTNNVFPNFTIKQTNISNGEYIPVQPRNEYWPLVYFVPLLQPYINLIGYDIGSDPISRDLFLNVINDNQNVSASSRINLVQGIYKNPYSYGVLMGLGTFANNIIIGGMYAVIQVKNLLFQSFVENLQNSDVNILVFDVTDDGLANNVSINASLLYKGNIDAYTNIWFENNISASFNTKRYVFQFADRTWVIYFSFLDSYIDKLRINTYIIITASVAAVLILIDAILLICNYYLNLYEKNIIIEREKKETLNHLIAFFNHEVRNPVNVIKGTLELNLEQLLHFVGLTNESESELIKFAINKETMDKKIIIPLGEIIPIISDYYTALGSCNLVEHIINDILVLRTLEENKLNIVEKNINVHEFAMQFNKSIKQKLNEKPQILYETCIDNDIQFVHTDPVRLTQIMLNYFTNAIKFTYEGKIGFNIYRVDDDIRLEISDTGIGIKEEDRPKLFNKFSQLEGKDFTRHNGFGLGLHICSMLAKRMNASVGFESKIGKGSKFWFQVKDDVSNDKVNIHINPQQTNDDDTLTFLDPFGKSKRSPCGSAMAEPAGPTKKNPNSSATHQEVAIELSDKIKSGNPYITTKG